MATSSLPSYHLLNFHSFSYSRHYNHLHTSSFFNSISIKRNPNSSFRLRALPKSKENPKSSIPPSHSSPSNSFLPPLFRFRYYSIFNFNITLNVFYFFLNFLLLLILILQRCTEFRWSWCGDIVDCIACSFGFSYWSYHFPCWYCICWSFGYWWFFIISLQFL